MKDVESQSSGAGAMSRRDCLAWLARASAIAVAGIATRSWGDDGVGMVHIAELIKIANDSARKVEKPSVILTRTSKGVACLSAVCTHKHNDLEVDKDGNIFCPVHSSMFDLEGNPSGGPATRPLNWYQTQISDSGSISVDAGRTVAQGQWAELPAWAKPKKK